jgi:hypothetical protein
LSYYGEATEVAMELSSDGATGAQEKLLATVAYGGQWCEGEQEQRNGTTVAWAYMYERAGGRHGRTEGAARTRLLVTTSQAYHYLVWFHTVSHAYQRRSTAPSLYPSALMEEDAVAFEGRGLNGATTVAIVPGTWHFDRLSCHNE